jgi:hypothetical protein
MKNTRVITATATAEIVQTAIESMESHGWEFDSSQRSATKHDALLLFFKKPKPRRKRANHES